MAKICPETNQECQYSYCRSACSIREVNKHAQPLYQPSVTKPVSKGCTLEELKPGTLFSFNGTIALKSEYYTATGAIEAFIVGSGEMFWGGTKDPKDQRKLIVSPISYAAQSHPKPQTENDAVEASKGMVVTDDVDFGREMDLMTSLIKQMGFDNSVTNISAVSIRLLSMMKRLYNAHPPSNNL